MFIRHFRDRTMRRTVTNHREHSGKSLQRYCCCEQYCEQSFITHWRVVNNQSRIIGRAIIIYISIYYLSCCNYYSNNFTNTMLEPSSRCSINNYRHRTQTIPNAKVVWDVDRNKLNAPSLEKRNHLSKKQWQINF